MSKEIAIPIPLPKVRIQEGFIRSPEEVYFEGEKGKQLEFPTSIMPKESRLKGFARLARRNTPKALMTAAGIGLPVCLAISTIDAIKDYQSYDGIYKPTENQGIEGIDNSYGISSDGEISESEKILLIDNYNLAISSFINYGQYELKTDYSEETVDFLRDGRRSLIEDGIDLLHKLGVSNHFELSRSENEVVFEDIHFELGNTYDEFMIAAIINQLLEMAHPAVGSTRLQDQYDNLSDIVWLSQNLSIDFREDSFPFPDLQVLLNTSRLYQTLTELEHPTPSRVIFASYSAEYDSAGWYLSHNNSNVVTDRASSSSIVHEEGHHQADENSKFSQEAFDEMFSRAVAEQGLLPNNGNLYISTYAMTKPFENYAESFEMYFSHGAQYRNILRDFYEANQPGYFVQKAVYDFFQEFFQGRQYVYDGEVFDPARNDIFRISDTVLDFAQAPIGLREIPEVDANNTGVVQNGDTVRILEGPVEMISDGDKRQMWKVQVIAKNIDGADEAVSVIIDGWIWDLWLGVEIGKVNTD